MSALGRLFRRRAAEDERDQRVAALSTEITELRRELEATRTGLVNHLESNTRNLNANIRTAVAATRRQLTLEVDMTRTRLAIPDDVVLELERYRLSPDYQRIFEASEPLVSITVTTFNRAELLVDRCLKSLLAQDYPNLEIIVVDDGSTDDTEARITALNEPRIRFARMAERHYPEIPAFAGLEAGNLALEMATGDFIGHLDDDDEYSPDRIGRLVRFMQAERAELVWHPFWWQPHGEWTVNDAEDLELAAITSGSALYIGWFKRIRWDAMAYRFKSPGDWDLFRMIRDMGAVRRRYPEPLMRHYQEGLNPRWHESDGRGNETVA